MTKYFGRLQQSIRDRFFSATPHIEINTPRRTFLKILLAGSGAIVAAKTLEAFGLFDNGILASREFQDFTIIETQDQLSVNNRSTGEPIMIFEKN